ncbi:tetratricopeptide repeat protein [Candidatus Spongiihabitans sp.]|uniref:tetratricopeptide repeat protein n=1 Tax=Candidatus Spongiihabitans sp. TaxID=3101308 RepID=UPI003C7C5790
MRTNITAVITMVALLLGGCETSTLVFKVTPKAPPEKWIVPEWTDSFTKTKRQAEHGDAEAQYQLATMYERGRPALATHDYRKALVWYRKSAAQGFVPAQYELGVMIADGIGTVRQQEDGVITYQRAILKGFDPWSTPCKAKYRGKTYHYAKCWGVR